MLFQNLSTVLVIVSTITSSGYLISKNKFLICSNSSLILLSEQILRALNIRHLIRLTFLDLGANASQQIQTSECRLYIYIYIYIYKYIYIYTSYESKQTSFNQYIQGWMYSDRFTWQILDERALTIPIKYIFSPFIAISLLHMSLSSCLHISQDQSESRSNASK